MLNDGCLTGLTWGDLETAWLAIASPDNRPHVPDFVSALWKESDYLPESFNLQRVLAATALLAGPPCFPDCGEEGSMT